MSMRYQASIVTASYFPLKVPNAPTSAVATAGNATASVAFTAPADVGAGAITSYTVTSSPGGITSTGASSPLTVSGLTNGTAYTFTVTATNAFGTGPASAASSAVTPAVPPVYIDDVFSTYLYTANGSTQTITNDIDLSTNSGLIWTKKRTDGTQSHVFVDTVRGQNAIHTSRTEAQGALSSGAITFGTTGYSFTGGVFSAYGDINNASGSTFVSYTFRKQAKFFDVVTYTGNGAASRSISHSLGSKPGCVIVKCTSTAGTAWQIVSRDESGAETVRVLNSTIAAVFSPVTDNSSYLNCGTTTTFNVTSNFDAYEPTAGAGVFSCNASGATYVAYIFAHNAGGFGASGTDNVITCSSFTTSGTGTPNATVNLGFEPQWLLIKRTDAVGAWYVYDTARGLIAPNGLGSAYGSGLSPNTSGAESNNAFVNITSTGFVADTGGNAQTWMYIAIRRPMKVPTVATSVFAIDRPSSSGTFTLESPFAPDWAIARGPNGGDTVYVGQRLTGTSALSFQNVNAEYALGYRWNIPTGATIDGSGNYSAWISYLFKRAPGFFDIACYTGNGIEGRLVNHNLGALPEFIMVKRRDAASGLGWLLSIKWFDEGTLWDRQGRFNEANGLGGGGQYGPNSSHTTTVFPVSNYVDVNASGGQYIAYLFATLAGISKVGSYTGTGTTQQINCGFTSGARFVMIKRADTGNGGDTYVWDTVRGIISGNDPYVLFNNSAAETINTDYIDPYNAGFEISSTAPAGINASGGRYVFLAIA